MKPITVDTVVTLTKLCHIDCSSEEVDQLLVDLRRILEYIERVHAIHADSVPPFCHLREGGRHGSLRDDKVGPMLDRKVLLANAPSHDGKYILIPPS